MLLLIEGEGIICQAVLGMMVGVGKGVARNLLINRLLCTFLWVWGGELWEGR